MPRHQETDAQMLFVFFFMNIGSQFESRPNVNPFIMNPVLITQKCVRTNLILIFICFPSFPWFVQTYKSPGWNPISIINTNFVWAGADYVSIFVNVADVMLCWVFIGSLESSQQVQISSNFYWEERTRMDRRSGWASRKKVLLPKVIPSPKNNKLDRRRNLDTWFSRPEETREDQKSTNRWTEYISQS